MSFEVFMSESGRHIVCRVSGPLDADLAREFTRAINDLSRDTCIDRFLFDVRDAHNTAQEIENYDFVRSVQTESDLQTSARSAILTAPGDTSHDSVQHMLSSAGFRARIFDNASAAVAWIDALTP